MTVIDNEVITLQEGDCLRIAPAAKRQFSAADDSELRFICIQVKEHSLEHYTMTDAVVEA